MRSRSTRRFRRISAGPNGQPDGRTRAVARARLSADARRRRRGIGTVNHGHRFLHRHDACIGCKACEVACKQWNELPSDGFTSSPAIRTITPRELSGTTWRHVAFVEQMRADETGLQDRWLMMSDVCKHCTNAGCLEACPTGAIIRNEFDSTSSSSPTSATAAAIASSSCPFGVVDLIAHVRSRRRAVQRCVASRRRAGRTKTATQHHGGVAGKCTLCYDRQKLGFVPACAKACPTESIQFGDVDELRERAKARVDTLQSRGRDAYTVRRG